MARDWAQIYRPLRFDDVLGQENAVEYLSGLIVRGQIGRNVLLSGDYGSGKTTLVRVYARALNCDAPTLNGSPCYACSWCCDRSESTLIAYSWIKRDTFTSWLAAHVAAYPPRSKRKVIFVDEAHLLRRSEMDRMLQAIEDAEDHLTFCLATTEPEKLTRPLKSRFHELAVKSLPLRLSLDLLERVAKDERIVYDPAALSLLAGLKAGHPRDLLIGLQQVADGGHPVTLERVRTVFDIDHAQVLTDYFLALAEGDLARQTNVIFSWRESPADKVRWVVNLLLFLYYNDILLKPLALDGVTSSIGSARIAIIERFCRRFRVDHHSALAPQWRDMMDFWSMPSAELDETAIHLRLTLFHHLVNEELPARSGQGEASCNPKVSGASPARVAAVARSAAEGATFIEGEPFPEPDWISDMPEEDPRYIRVRDVRDVINRASYLTQQHGLLFNVAIELRPWYLGYESEEDGRRLSESFLDGLQAQIREWRGNEDLTIAALTLFERDEDGLRTIIIAHLPRPSDRSESNDEDCVVAGAAWASKWA